MRTELREIMIRTKITIKKSWVMREYFFWLYQALPGFTRLDRSEAVGALERWSVEALERFAFVDFSYRLGRCRIAERVIYARDVFIQRPSIYRQSVKMCEKGYAQGIRREGVATN